MKIEVRLFANLRDLLPDAPRGRATLEVGEGTTLLQLIEMLGVEPRLAQMVLVNGEQMPRKREDRGAIRLAPGDTVAIFPPLAGG